ncbi:PspC domain-containing protein [Rhodohalobacter sp. 8-1]|uniref:PspC domain-containing protein n=1 Tax=Rhodohalobacter sp. 8-1 TaxID=3131972 RepID=UPI0030ECFA7A
MTEHTKSRMHTSTINVTDEDLQQSLKSFLETNEEKESPSIWNIKTISGLALVFITLAFVGQSIGAELMGTTGVSFLTTVMRFLPYLGGAMLAVISLGFMKQSKAEKKSVKEEETQKKKTYDKLDDFLYTDDEPRSRSSRSTQTKQSKKRSFRNKLSVSGGLSRSRTDSKIFGVCGGLAKYLGMNSTVLRIGFLIAFFLSSGSFLLLYIAMAIVMPKESIDDMDDFR